MAFTDEQKLNFAKQALKIRVMAVDEWATFKSLVENITSNQLKNLIKSALADEKEREETEATESTADAADYQSLWDEIDGI